MEPPVKASGGSIFLIRLNQVIIYCKWLEAAFMVVHMFGYGLCVPSIIIERRRQNGCIASRYSLAHSYLTLNQCV